MPKSKQIDIENNADCNKEILFDLMCKYGFEKIIIYFDGGGDDGAINEIECRPSKNRDKFLDEIVKGGKIKVSCGWSNGAYSYRDKPEPSIREIVEDICYKVLENQFSGWENDDGCCGEFVIDATKRKVELEMRARYYEYDVSLYQF
jgi:hypothetical protein